MSGGGHSFPTLALAYLEGGLVEGCCTLVPFLCPGGRFQEVEGFPAWPLPALLNGLGETYANDVTSPNVESQNILHRFVAC